MHKLMLSSFFFSFALCFISFFVRTLTLKPYSILPSDHAEFSRSTCNKYRQPQLSWCRHVRKSSSLPAAPSSSWASGWRSSSLAPLSPSGPRPKTRRPTGMWATVSGRGKSASGLFAARKNSRSSSPTRSAGLTPAMDGKSARWPEDISFAQTRSVT